ncbi:MAG: RagB/SusD family nutrient uptake outer membrane protein [Bacteroidales bacterium]|nr:RagB/SusD family nutrient uptake outer membrane protein [Bacteroidales bacterium]MBQ1683436.1 RagB/SusD family nutrient uptake outer membrane protein [Bacteroidales bacterium]MBQ1717927.1 RagB/SusD family nutrient uptake outer membrane protein [Bacteroidales bacterium]MBQ2222172.1 RagB/SusD family nutrient uptake outer membrane protein [Bacteroidales bacterium]MBQ3942536.1 RagB/SusD family nutrient uptake outer membrane protein [Bacteroidales bacterium]
MKTRNIIIALAFASVLFQACSLQEDLSPISTPDNYFRSKAECESVVNGCYIPMKSFYNYTFLIATECCTDVAYCASGTLDARLDISPATPRHGQTVWTQCYMGVQRCNFAIQGIENSRAFIDKNTHEIDPKNADRIRLLCEAKVLRAFYYYTLTCFFGDVPFYFDDVEDLETLDRIGVLPRMSAVETRNKCIEDLQAIAPFATQTRTSDNEEHRLGAATAYMLIAKMAMWNQRWDTALEALGHLEEIYGDFSQYDYAENVMFRNKNTPESILEIQHTYTQGGTVYTSNVAAICMPNPRTSGTDYYDGIQVSELGDQATSWSPMRPNVIFCQGLQSKMSKDIRKNYNMAWSYDGHDFKSVNTRPWCGPKFWCPNMYQTNDGNNYKIFRYADAILMIAECYNEKDMDAKAVEYLNKTRTRAGLSEYVFRTHVRLQTEIRNERARELFGEFQRKFDLVRWGIWYEETLANSNYNALLENIQPCHRFYPIPEQEVIKSKYALDNKEYEKYGL